MGTNIFNDLALKSERVDWHKEKRKVFFALFSKSGFTLAMMELAKEKQVLLFHGDTLFPSQP